MSAIAHKDAERYIARPDRAHFLFLVFGADQGYADLVPALQRVVQAAGRVLRTPQDRGWLWLLDDRYRRPEVIERLPAWWNLAAAQLNADRRATVPAPS